MNTVHLKIDVPEGVATHRGHPHTVADPKPVPNLPLLGVPAGVPSADLADVESDGWWFEPGKLDDQPSSASDIVTTLIECGKALKATLGTIRDELRHNDEMAAAFPEFRDRLRREVEDLKGQEDAGS